MPGPLADIKVLDLTWVLSGPYAAMTLCDLGAKYADIVKTDEVLSYFDTLPAGMFDLPKGVPA